MRRLFFLLLFTCPLFAQLQSVVIGVSGMDCESCAGSIETRFKRIRGVEAVQYDRQKSIITIRFAAENKATLSLVRDSLKGLGYTPGDATLTLKGIVQQENGLWILSLPSQSETLELESMSTPKAGTRKVSGVVPAGSNKLRAASIE